MPIHHLEAELWKASQAISAYDAHYVVLASAMNVLVATFDARLAKSNSLGVRFVLVS
jgi:predicted nucleic acid-binding protein